jgi:putative transposase
MLNRFEYAGRNDKKIKFYKFWLDWNQAKEIYSNEFPEQMLDYIHKNSIVEIVYEPNITDTLRLGIMPVKEG